MGSLSFLVFDTIYLDKDRAASLHRKGAWIGKVNWYARAADGGGDGDGPADAKPGGEQHLHRDRGAFEGIGEQRLGGWLQSLGETKNALSPKQVIFLSNQACRCLLAVGDTPGQQVGSVVFGIPANPNTSAGNEKLGDAMWQTHGDDNEPCCIEIKRNHVDLWVFDDAINGRQEIWVGGELVTLFHKPQAVANGASSTFTICIDLRATDLNDAMAYIKQACNSIAQKVADDKAPPRKAPDDGSGGWLRPEDEEGGGPL
jgi:hypothetical protein